MKIAIVVGTRPEVIKMSPIIRECQKRGVPFTLIHSNQHYSENMDAIFFEELGLPAPHYNLNVGSGGHANQTGNILIKIEPILEKENPDVLLTQGDTNTVLAAALAAQKLGIKVGHVEAGLRSYDRTMPEETNRVATDHMSDYLFAVSGVQKEILTSEGVDNKKIHTVGNTVTDALLYNLGLAESKSKALDQNSLIPGKYILFTSHRSSNVDYKDALGELIEVINTTLARYPDCKFIWPIHPRARKKIKEFGYSLSGRVIQTEPLGYMDFIWLEKNAAFIMTDSGGLQEEACILQVPCITLRENTERPETVTVGGSKICGRDPKKVVDAFNYFESRANDWENPFGKGDTSRQIIDILTGTRSEVSREESIVVVGMGYMGLPTAGLFANAGFNVTGIDLIQEKVDSINRGECPFDEPGMPELVSTAVASGKLKASTEIPEADVYIIAVPTPHKDEACDLSFVIAASKDIAKIAPKNSLVILESTVGPNTCKNVLSELFPGMDISHCPERAIPGETLNELVNNDRIIGGLTEKATRRTTKLYKSFARGGIFETDATTAECVKLTENTSRDVGIAFANELGEVCKEIGVDVHEVIKLANRHPRVSILNPGPGVGGHCIPIDPWFLVEKSKCAKLIPMARRINDEKPHIVASEIIFEAKEKGYKRIGILGVAYKKDVDDLRETPAEPIVKDLLEAGLEVKFHDPHVGEWIVPRVIERKEIESWADMVFIVTQHSCF